MATERERTASTTVDHGLDQTYRRAREYVLVEMNRYVLAAVLLVVAVTPLVVFDTGSVFAVDEASTPLFHLYSTIAAANVTLITIVVSINQLVLSRELRSPRELESEIHAVEDFRSDVQSETDRLVVPEVPADFLRILVSETRDDVAAIADAFNSLDSDDFRGDVDDLVGTLEAELDDTLAELEKTGAGVFPALATILDADFSTHINHARWHVRANADAMPDALQSRFERLEDELEQLDVTRQYFKTVYITQELADVSRLMLSTGLIAVALGLTLLVLSGLRVTPIPPPIRPALVPISVAVGLAPLVLLVTHVLRIATVAHRTAAITPFRSPTE